MQEGNIRRARGIKKRHRHRRTSSAQAPTPSPQFRDAPLTKESQSQSQLQAQEPTTGVKVRRGQALPHDSYLPFTINGKHRWYVSRETPWPIAAPEPLERRPADEVDPIPAVLLERICPCDPPVCVPPRHLTNLRCTDPPLVARAVDSLGIVALPRRGRPGDGGLENHPWLSGPAGPVWAPGRFGGDRRTDAAGCQYSRH